MSLSILRCFPKRLWDYFSIFYLFVLIRLSAVFLVQTFFVPDEYYQSLEVAHKIVFGYGYLTWEWQEGIRSYAYPMLFSYLYKILELFDWDSQWAVIYVPRIAQALLSAYSDLCFYRWCGRTRWSVISISTSWFWYYTCSRTLINTFEACLTTIALSQYPWAGRRDVNRFKFIWIVAILFVTRPTSAIIWLPLCWHHIRTLRTRSFYSIVSTYIWKGLPVLAVSIALDSYCHGYFVITAYKFAIVNVFSNIGAIYGTHPWHWYFTSGLVTVLGIQLLPFLMAVIAILVNMEDYPNELALLKAGMFSIFVLSCLPHKEFRFLLPLLPIMLFLSSKYLSTWSMNAKSLRIYLVFVVILLGNLFPAWYIGYNHQRGTLDVMHHLNQVALKVEYTNPQFLFLMPCHSTPLYSYLHVKVHAAFLTCNPNLRNVPSYVDETDTFYDDPEKWWNNRYPADVQTPSHIICFDTIDSDFESNVLERYERKYQFFHTNFPINSRIGRYVVVLELKTNVEER